MMLAREQSGTSTVRRRPMLVHEPILQNFVLIWLDLDNNVSNDDYHNATMQLQHIVNATHTFNDVDDCIDFLTEIEDQKVLMIISGTVHQHLIRLIHDIPRLHSVYIFCHGTENDRKQTNEWSKVRGISAQTLPICNSIKQTARQYDPNPCSVSFLSSDNVTTSNLNRLDQSFMYSQILKEILLEIDFDVDIMLKSMATLYRAEYLSNHQSTIVLDRFEQNYHNHTPIWWYTSEGFIYSTLNEALRTQEIDNILRMSFFLRALHKDIKQLHSKQMNDHHMGTFTVYRGQAMMKEDFEKMTRTKGGLMSFNNFLSTSTEPTVAHLFAGGSQIGPNSIPIFFEMTIDTSVPSAPFANLDNVSRLGDAEKEILFSMHTVFRIDDIETIEDNNRFWRVKLTLTSDTDKELLDVTKKIREEIEEDSTPLFRLGRFLILFGEYDTAKELYQSILDLKADDDNLKVYIYGQLGKINEDQGNYSDAVSLYDKTLEVYRRLGCPDHFEIGTLYNNIGKLYHSMGEYSKALLHYQKSLEMEENRSLPNELKIALIYTNIGVTYRDMHNYPKSFECCEKSLEINERVLPSHDPRLALSYNNIALAAQGMRKYTMALSFYEKALEIHIRTLPPNHPNFILLYNNMGGVYFEMDQYLKARSFHKKSLEIRQIIYPADHPSLASSYSNIGLTYAAMGEYSDALVLHEKALEIRQKTLPLDYPKLVVSYNTVGTAHRLIGDYSKALLFYEKALETCHRFTPPDDTLVANCHINMGDAYFKMAEYSNAISSYEKGLEIRRNILPMDHPDLGLSYNNLGSAYFNMKDYSKAHSFLTQAFEIYEKTLPQDHPHITQYYNNIGILYSITGEDAKALLSLEKALESRQRTLPSNHPELANSYHHIGRLCTNKGDYSKALSYLKKALEISEISLHSNHPDLAYICNGMGLIYESMGDHSVALSFFRRAVDIGLQSLPSDHPKLQEYTRNLNSHEEL